MKDAIILLLCAVALAQGINQNPEQRTGPCNCDPSEANQICQANYDNDDVLIAHENCNKFYKCANGKPIAYFCPDNLLYDPFTEQCEWPHKVDCGDRPIAEGPVREEDNDSDDVSDTGNDGTCNCNPGEAPYICAAEGSNGILVAHQNCNQFYKCAEGKPVTFDCSPTLLYNPYTGECDWPHTVDCGDRVIPGPEDNISSDADDTPENDGTCNCNPEEAPAICAAPGSESELIAHENCNKYYICNHGLPVAVSCFGDLLFNPYTKQCDWPRDVDCGDRIVPETECTGCNDDTSGDTSCDGDDVSPPPEDDQPPINSEPEDSDSSDIRPPGDDVVPTRPPGTCNCNPEEAPSICAAEGSDGVLVAHENCNQFYKCDHGKPVVLNCHGDLLYNPYTEQCDWPENVDCGNRVTPDPEQITSTPAVTNPGVTNPGVTNPGVTNPGVTNPPGNNCDPNEAPAICAADDSEGVLVAHENCNQFYKCSGGKPVALYCPKDLLFNPAKDECDWPFNVVCGDRVIQDPDSSESVEIPPPGDGVVVPTRPPGTCNCNPEEAPSICAAEDSDGVLVAHENCNQFYKCDHGKPVALKCYGNLLYNPYTEQCDWPENVDCGNRGTPDPDQITYTPAVTNPGVTNPVVTNPGVTNPGVTNPGVTNPGVTNPPGNNCDPNEAPAICAADDSEGVLVAHENCNQFYKCSGGKPIALYCPKGLLFNPAKDECDWPFNVDCGDRVIQDPDSTESVEIPPPGDGVVVPTRPPGTCNCNPEEAPFICAAEDSDGVLIAHENCNQFYKCDHSKPVAFKCYGNLLYNPYTEQCDWPENVDCGNRGTPDPDQITSTPAETNPGVTNPGVTNPGVTNPGVTNPGVTNPGVTNPPGNNCDPSEAPAICAADDSEGVLVAHENCNQFYVCNGGKPVVLTCPAGLLFNPAKDECDWPFNVACGDRVIQDPDSSESVEIPPPGDGVVVPTRPPGTCNCNPEEAPSICAAEDSNGVLIAHENCNQFYKCDHGKPVAFKCYGNLLYNPYTEQCDWPENVDCGNRGTPDPDQITSTPAVTNPGVTNPGVSNPGVTNPGVTNPGVTNPGVTNPPGNNCDPSEAPAICAADDSEGVLVAHENCNQFYMCNGGKPVVLTCPAGLLFNPAKDECDWPFNVACGDRVIQDPDSSESVEIPPPGDGVVVPTRPPGTCNCNPEEAPSICAAEDSNGVLIAHEICNQFYKCDHSKPVAFKCYGNLLYNPYTEQCDWPENVDCGNRGTPDPEQITSTPAVTNPGVTNPGVTNPGVTNPAVTNPPGNNCDPSEAPAICAADDSEGVLVAHENCNQFYVCNGGKPVVLTCPAGLLFNPAKDECDWPFKVDCGDRVIQDPDSSESVEIPPPGDGVVVPTRPPGTCNCNPEEAPSICAAEDSNGVLIAHENCNQFYKCDHGKPVAFKCYGNLLYNPYTEQCDWPENVDCGNRGTPDPDQITSTPAVTNPGVTNPGVTNPGVTNPGVTNPGVTNPGVTNPPGNNCDPSEAPAICAADDSEGVLVAHENCNQFYVCNGGKPVVLTCPAGLLFNPAKDECDWPFNVACGDRVIQDPDSSESVEIPPPGDGVVVPTRPPGTCNCNPEEAPSICAAEDSNGVLIAHEICNQFYKCDHGKPVAFKCYGNLLYNPYTEQCDWPENVDCGNRGTPDPEQITSTPAVTNPGVTNPGVTNPGVTNPGVTNPAVTNPPGNNCDPSEAPAICAADDSEGVLVAHENCNQFYVCNGGKPVVLTCPAGLLFNPAKDECDWPFKVDCGDRVIQDPDSSESVEIPPPGDGVVVPTRPPGTCNCNPEEAPSICAAKDSDGVLIAHENCNQFYKCDHGKPVAFKCYGNLLYNPYTEQCDWPENVDCGNRGTPDPEQITSTPAVTNPAVTTPVVTNPAVTTPVVTNPAITTPVVTNPPITTQGVTNPAVTTPGSTTVDADCSGNSGEDSGQCNCDPDQAPSICAINNSDGVLIAHENCNQFYKCDNGKPVPFRCPAKTLYNPVSQGCDWAFNVDCGDRIIPDTEEDVNESKEDESEEGGIVGPCNCNPEEAPAICAADGSGGVQIAHQNCNQYYVCDHGRPVAFSCSGFLLYNPYTQSCEWPQNVECGDRVIPEPVSDESDNETEEDNNNVGNDDPSQAPAICAGYGSEGVLVAHENCDQYYICAGGVPVTQPCNEGLLFNPFNQRCDWPNNVVCGDRIVPDDCACNPRNAPALCSQPGSQDKLIAHENCNQFYKCDHSVPVAQICPDGLLYNIDSEWCDWPENVNCDNRIVSSASLNKHFQSRQTLRN